MKKNKFKERGKRKFGRGGYINFNNFRPENSSTEGDFVKRMTSILGLSSRKGQVQEIFSAKAYKGLRINPLLVKTPDKVKEVRDELIKQGIDVIQLTWYPDGFVILAKDVPFVMSLPMSKEGLVFVQNPSSFLPIIALDPQPGEKYLDVCSAPGGKAVLYAGLSKGESSMCLVDDNPFRVNIRMREVLESQKVKPDKIIICDARQLFEQKKIKADSFDKVLVDADCSSEGLINFASKNPLREWAFKSAKRFSHLQLKFLSIGYSALKPGGILVYSTCTLSPEENEGVISRFLEKTPGAVVQKMSFNGQKTCNPITFWPGQQMSPEVEKTLRIDPRDSYMEGFFICRIIKSLPENDSPEGLINKQKNNEFASHVINLDQLGVKHSVFKKNENQ